MKGPSADILGINAMLEDTDDDEKDDEEKLGEEDGSDLEAKWSSEVASYNQLCGITTCFS